MAKHRIFTVGFDLPGDEFEYVQFDSDTTLLDADIILFEPTLGNASGSETYNGTILLNEHSSFSVKQRLDHWRSEIVAAVKAGKVVVVYLAKPIDRYRYTGEKQHSGTGRSRLTTNIVTEVSSYEAIPNLKRVVPKSGTEIQIDKDANYLAPYWSEFSNCSPYEVEIEGEFKNQISLRSRAGNRTLGAAVRGAAGTLLFLPPLRYERKTFIRHDEKSEETFWTKEAEKFGKRLVVALVGLATSLKQAGQSTPPPSWTSESKFRLASEGRLEAEIAERTARIVGLLTEKQTLEDELVRAGSLRRLLYEQGKPLEAAVLESVTLLGFQAQPFAQGESEFDCVFVSAEGRCLGEAEGKDNRPINIDKFSQLERNLQEDFARDEITEYAKGVLFGNAFRLRPPGERGEYFTEKCLSAAKRVGAALVRTPDLFPVAKYLQVNTGDTEYARQCREAIFKANGEIVAFPAPPADAPSVVEVQLPSNEARPNIQVPANEPSTGGASVT